MTEQRLINVAPLMTSGWHLVQTGKSNEFIKSMSLADVPVIDAIEVEKVIEAKQDLLQIVDEFIAEYRHISQSYVDHFGGKADAMETARRLINNKLTDLCRKR